MPVVRALAIAGNRVAGGVGTHETALATPDRVNLGGRCVLPGFSDAHVHFPSWSLAQREVRLEDTASLDEALARVSEAAGSVEPGRLAARPRLEERRLVSGRRSDPSGARRGHRRQADGAHGPRLPLALAQLGRARPGRRRAPGRGRRRRARRARASRPGSCARSPPGTSATATCSGPMTSSSRRCAKGSGSRPPAASPPCTTRTAGWARRASGSGSPRTAGSRFASGSRCPTTTSAASRRSASGRASATTCSGSAT